MLHVLIILFGYKIREILKFIPVQHENVRLIIIILFFIIHYTKYYMYYFVCKIKKKIVYAIDCVIFATPS